MTRFHYAWVVVAVTFLALLVASSVRAAPGILITPLEREFGWDRATISAAIAVSILTFGLGGPISGTLVNRFGPRKVILFGCLAIAAGLGDTRQDIVPIFHWVTTATTSFPCALIVRGRRGVVRPSRRWGDGTRRSVGRRAGW